MKYAISSCLCGINCKYNGGNNLDLKCKSLYDNGEAILICPEVLGGLSIPRNPSEIKGDRVISSAFDDVTEYFNKGALEALEILKENGVTKAILKDGSPSCGINYIYDGTFTKRKICGMGITARLLVNNGITVISSEDFGKE